MRVLVISTDPAAALSGSETSRRLEEYATALGELHVVTAEEKGYFFLLRWWKMLQNAWRVMRKFRCEIITVQAPDEWGFIGFLLSRFWGVPLQIQVHTDIMSSWYRRASWKERVRYYFARFLIPRADCVRVVSERIKRSLLKSLITNHESRITVLPIFTDIKKFLEAPRDAATDARFCDYDFKMIAVGRFVDKEKNFSMLIEVMRDFVKMCPQALLVIVGDGPDRKNYQLSIINYQLEKNVVLEPWRDDLPSFYKSFDLYLMSSNYEGWGRTVIEAMASGLPVLMTEVGLAGEVVQNGENSVIVSVGDKAAFLQALMELYNNSKKRIIMAKQAQETARSFLPGTKEEYLRLYRESFCISDKL